MVFKMLPKSKFFTFMLHEGLFLLYLLYTSYLCYMFYNVFVIYSYLYFLILLHISVFTLFDLKLCDNAFISIIYTNLL